MLQFQGEVMRINVIEPRDDFAGGAMLSLGDDTTDVTVWAPAEVLPQLASIKRLQRVNVQLAAKEREFTQSRNGISKPTKAVKLSVLKIAAV